jgi:hypothetical protein
MRKKFLILPFSVFKVENRFQNISDTSSTMLVEIYLEGCPGNQPINYQKQISELDHYQTFY